MKKNCVHLRKIFYPFWVSFLVWWIQNTKLNEEVIRLLKEKGLTLATAESCTGGLLASALVNVEGASSVFLEGIVTYSYES